MALRIQSTLALVGATLLSESCLAPAWQGLIKETSLLLAKIVQTALLGATVVDQSHPNFEMVFQPQLGKNTVDRKALKQSMKKTERASAVTLEAALQETERVGFRNSSSRGEGRDPGKEPPLRINGPFNK